MSESALPAIPMLPHITSIISSVAALGSSIGYVCLEDSNRTGAPAIAASSALICANSLATGASLTSMIHAMRANNASEAYASSKQGRR